MNLIDLLVFLCALTTGVRGLRRGLILEGIEAVSAFGGLALAYRLRHGIGSQLAVSTGLPEALARGFVFVGIAVLVTSVGFGAAAWLREMAPREGPWAKVDGLGGLAFGAAKGTVYAALILVMFAQIPFPFVTDWTFGSAVCRALFSLLPDVYGRLNSWFE